ncbi:hypothetical protein BDN72DRAFT_895562 [Pluteus cervinus]|uniref:Uncharacterized protein n=1 Tax=Pluteus cervinus TaxID=181527 RepID=A0ACD3B175_9AGAR|nr:hypothetical protein BDN72DRAFT_895562 [Pluteus cervinus]
MRREDAAGGTAYKMEQPEAGTSSSLPLEPPICRLDATQPSPCNRLQHQNQVQVHLTRITPSADTPSTLTTATKRTFYCYDLAGTNLDLDFLSSNGKRTLDPWPSTPSSTFGVSSEGSTWGSSNYSTPQTSPSSDVFDFHINPQVLLNAAGDYYSEQPTGWPYQPTNTLSPLSRHHLPLPPVPTHSRLQPSPYSLPSYTADVINSPTDPLFIEANDHDDHSILFTSNIAHLQPYVVPLSSPGPSCSPDTPLNPMATYYTPPQLLETLPATAKRRRRIKKVKDVVPLDNSPSSSSSHRHTPYPQINPSPTNSTSPLLKRRTRTRNPLPPLTSVDVNELPILRQQIGTDKHVEASIRRRKRPGNIPCTVPSCPRTFTAHHSLKRHLESHNRTLHECWGCGYSYATRDNVKRHIRENKCPALCPDGSLREEEGSTSFNSLQPPIPPS